MPDMTWYGVRQYRILETCDRHGGMWPGGWHISGLDRECVDRFIYRGLLKHVEHHGDSRIALTDEGRKALARKPLPRYH